MKKGLELPINMIVIIALAVFILVVIVAFATSQIGGGVSSISLEASFSKACTAYRNDGCPNAGQSMSGPGQGQQGATTTSAGLIDVKYKQDVQGWGTGKTLREICTQKGLTTDFQCRQACGCLAP
jgi:hypothetical protein